MKICFLLLVVLFMQVHLAVAQECDTASVCNCQQTDLSPAGVMMSHEHPKGSWMLSYRYMNASMNGVLSGTQETSKNDVFVNYLMAPEKMQMDMHMLMGMYGITGRLTTMVMLNYNVMSMNMTMFGSGTHHHAGGASNSMVHQMNTSGIGDAKVYGLFTVLKKQEQLLLLSTGVNIPSGTIDKKGNYLDAMYPNSRLPYSMQMGSGSVEVLPGITYMIQKESTTFSAQVSSVIRTGYNHNGYKLGNEATLTTWFAWKWLNFLSSSVRVEGSVTDQISGYDASLYSFNEPSANSYNYGGERINGYIGSVFHFNKSFLKNTRLSVEYGLPVYQYLNGLQMKHKSTLNASWSVIF